MIHLAGPVVLARCSPAPESTASSPAATRSSCWSAPSCWWPPPGVLFVPASALPPGGLAGLERPGAPPGSVPAADPLLSGQVLTVFAITIAAAEIGLALAVILLLFRVRRTSDLSAVRELGEASPTYTEAPGCRLLTRSPGTSPRRSPGEAPDGTPDGTSDGSPDGTPDAAPGGPSPGDAGGAGVTGAGTAAASTVVLPAVRGRRRAAARPAQPGLGARVGGARRSSPRWRPRWSRPGRLHRRRREHRIPLPGHPRPGLGRIAPRPARRRALRDRRRRRSALVALCVQVYSTAYLADDRPTDPVERAHPLPRLRRHRLAVHRRDDDSSSTPTTSSCSWSAGRSWAPAPTCSSATTASGRRPAPPRSRPSS